MAAGYWFLSTASVPSRILSPILEFGYTAGHLPLQNQLHVGRRSLTPAQGPAYALFHFLLHLKEQFHLFPGESPPVTRHVSTTHAQQTDAWYPVKPGRHQLKLVPATPSRRSTSTIRITLCTIPALAAKLPQKSHDGCFRIEAGICVTHGFCAHGRPGRSEVLFLPGNPAPVSASSCLSWNRP